MDTKRALCGFLVVPLFAGVATAAGPLSDRQMDIVTGGDPPTFVCPDSCGNMGASSGSTSTNGVTTNTTGTGGSSGTGGSTGSNPSLSSTLTQLQASLAASGSTPTSTHNVTSNGSDGNSSTGDNPSPLNSVPQLQAYLAALRFGPIVSTH
jgi:hypothetical protein